MLPDSLTRHLSTSLLNEMVSPEVFQRGQRLASKGRVEITGVTDYVIHARVDETKFRRFDLWFRAAENDLECKCSCRKTVQGACCKHVVAAGLLVLQGAQVLGKVDGEPEGLLVN